MALPAYHMIFTEGHHGTLDRLGGLPSHLPPQFPRYEGTDNELRFLAQFYGHPDRMNIEGILCLQLYQDKDDVWPVVVPVPLGAPENTSGLGVQAAEVKPHDVSGWTYVEESEEEEDDDLLNSSKLGGKDAYWCLGEGERLVLQLEEMPGNFDFGTRILGVVERSDGILDAIILG